MKILLSQRANKVDKAGSLLLKLRWDRMKYLMETQLALDKDQHITKMVIKTNSDLQETQAQDILASKIKTMNFLKN